jgi:pantoate--beta-alanine ligase
MGALHEGHLSLLKQCKEDADICVCSIFINPTQFNDKKDYEKYPSSIEDDINKTVSVETDILLLPDKSALYPDGTSELEQYELGYLEAILEGKSRPGHFQGVSQVMRRLLKIVEPDKLFMGQKDLQQSLIIKQLLKVLETKTELIVCPTKRESSGLAMSSRNMRLTEADRKKAAAIFQTLVYIKQNLNPGNLIDLKQKASALLIQDGFLIDYIEIADANTLQLVNVWDGRQKLVALIAVYLNEVRLIDNMFLNS